MAYMRDIPEQRFPGRRSVVAGILGTLALTMTGCGIRADHGPQSPSAGPDDRLRNRVAELLAGIDADGKQAAAVTTLRDAIGPVWKPQRPSANPAPSSTPTDFSTGLEQIVTTVVSARPAGAMATVLADVAVGSALALVEYAGADATTQGKHFTALSDRDPVPHSGTATASPSSRETKPSEPLALYAQTCYQAAVGYRRVAVALAAKDPYRQFAAGREQALDLAAARANVILHGAGLAPAANRAAYRFGTKPHDAASAKRLARRLEDALAGALPAVLTGTLAPRFACAQLWASGWARSRAGGAQLVRFDYSGQTPGALAPDTGQVG